MKLKKADVKHILEKTFPEYRGRKFKLAFATGYQMQDYWSGGSRIYVKAVNEEGKVAHPSQMVHNPWKDAAHAEFDLPKNMLLVEHAFFCGKDMGIRIIAHPNSTMVKKLLPEQ